MTVSFTVIGTPAPQGSKTKWGTEENPNTRPWRAAVAASASEAHTYHTADGTSGYKPVLDEAVRVAALFVFPRPKHHYGSGRNSHVLKPTAPAWCSTKPDADKLARAVGDAITGVLVRDDAQIVEWSIRKVYGSPARAQIDVTAADAAPP